MLGRKSITYIIESLTLTSNRLSGGEAVASFFVGNYLFGVRVAS
jgi:hypothetical protein